MIATPGTHFYGKAALVTRSEQIFTAFVILFVLFLLLAMAPIYFVVMPGLDSEKISVYYLLLAIFSLYVAVFSVTAAVNLYHRSLLVIPTVIQCVMLVLTVWGLPLAIWGYLLLSRRPKPPVTDSSNLGVEES